MCNFDQTEAAQSLETQIRLYIIDLIDVANITEQTNQVTCLTDETNQEYFLDNACTDIEYDKTVGNRDFFIYSTDTRNIDIIIYKV